MSFCDWLWVMHNSSMLEYQSGLHQGTKMYITTQGFPSISPFLLGSATEACSAEKGSDGAALMSVWHPVRVNTLQRCSGDAPDTTCTWQKSVINTTARQSLSFQGDSSQRKQKKTFKSRNAGRNAQTKMTLGSGPFLGSISCSRDPGCAVGCPDAQVREFRRAWKSLFECHGQLSSIWEIQKVTKPPKLSSFFLFWMMRNFLENGTDLVLPPLILPIPLCPSLDLVPICSDSRHLSEGKGDIS